MKTAEKISIRLDTRSCMLIDEIAKESGYNRSVVIRMLLTNSLNQIVDERGYISKTPIEKDEL